MTTVVAESVTQLSLFSDPASVAVVGASADPAKWGYWLASGALTGEHRRRVHLVNRRTDTLLERQCHPSLSALPEVPDLVALCVPAPFVSDVVDEALALGVRGFLGITAGVPGETELAARIRSAGARLVGTNSLGIYDSATDLSLAWGRFTPGPLAIISQSGQLGSELAALGARHGVGVSRFVSIGNQSDVTAAELLADLGGHDPTRVIALYLESFSDGESLFRTLCALRDTGRPTLLLTVGASAASTRLARSHTGSLTSALDVVDAACRAAGVLRVSTPDELITVARAFLSTTVPAGNRVAIVGDSGGQCAIAADVTSASALTVPDFSPRSPNPLPCNCRPVRPAATRWTSPGRASRIWEVTRASSNIFSVPTSRTPWCSPGISAATRGTLPLSPNTKRPWPNGSAGRPRRRANPSSSTPWLRNRAPHRRCGSTASPCSTRSIPRSAPCPGCPACDHLRPRITFSPGPFRGRTPVRILGRA